MDNQLPPAHKSWAKVRNTRRAVTKLRISPAQVHSFLAKLTLKTSVAVFRTCSLLKAAPFELVNNQSLDVRKFQSKWKLAKWHFSNWLVYISVAFQLVTYVNTLRFETGINAFCIHTVYFVSILFVLVFMYSLYRKPDGCILMLRQHRILLDVIADLGVTIPHWSTHPFVIVSVNYLASGVATAWFCMTAFFFIRPQFPCYLFSYIPSAYQNLWVMGICYIYECTWLATGLSVVVAFYCYWCAEIFTFISCLNHLLGKRYWNAADIKLYKCLQVFCITFNDFNGSFFTVGFNVTLVTLPIVYIYLALTVTGVHIIVFLIFPMMTVFNVGLIIGFLPQHSKVRSLSSELMNVMKRGKRTTTGMQVMEGRGIGVDAKDVMALHKEMAAFAPLGIRIWFFGVYTLGTSEVLMDQMFENVLLLMSL